MQKNDRAGVGSIKSHTRRSITAGARRRPVNLGNGTSACIACSSRLWDNGVDNVPVLCFLAVTCSPAGPERSGRVSSRGAARWLTGRVRGVGRRPRRRPQPPSPRAADRCGAHSVAGDETGRQFARRGRKCPSRRPASGTPEGRCGPVHYGAGDRLEGRWHGNMRVPGASAPPETATAHRTTGASETPRRERRRCPGTAPGPAAGFR